MREIELPEDLPITGMKYALISIIGPHMPQKCDTWGIKIGGYADSMEKAKTMVKRMMAQNKDFDIYTVDVGKFFPLAVEPMEVETVEYQNKQLNDLMKNYLENRSFAQEEFDERKNDLMEEAVEHGKKHRENASLARIEHPVAVLSRMKELEQKVEKLKSQIKHEQEMIEKVKEKFHSYTEEEKAEAQESLLKAIKNNETIVAEEKEMTAEEIRDSIMSDLMEKKPEYVDELQTQLKNLELSKEEGKVSYTIYKQQKELLLKKLQKQSSDTVNEFMKEKWEGKSKFENIF